jgi:hypothetical protein
MQFRVSRLLLGAALLVLVVGSGVVHGLVTDRWAPAEKVAGLDLVPMTIEDWDGTEIEADSEQLPQVRETSVLLRRYVNRTNGAVVTMFLTGGRAGPIVSAHQPDSCYPGAGYGFASPITKRSFAAGPADRTGEFRVTTFSKTERASPVYLRVYWSFTADGEWRSPDNPRLTFAGRRQVYKLYVIRQLTRSDEPLDGDPAGSFIQALLPAMEKIYFATP